MKIKSLTLNGFKSFANKTIINFQDGLTGIVGPNGSGKSNITEALRWVLGEQSVKNLRGSKMPDIIFAGSDTRAALNRAEVTLVLDNEDGYLYNQPNEIRITRRIFRSGDSEFFINEKKVRLKDVVDLFIDTGLGRESFSIISQGRVESIFNSKPQDRRILIEEVAGVLKYKKEKKKAESELVETTEHLKRVADILSELSRQRDPLAQQASKAKDYLSQKEQYDLLNRDRLVLEITQKSSEKEQKESELQKVIKILSDKERMTSEQSKQVEVLHSRQKKLESLIDNEQNELTELVRQEEKISGQQNMSRQEEKFQKRDEAFEDRKRQQAREIKRINDEIVSKSEELDREMIEDATVDAMLKMQLIAKKPIDDKRNYRIKERGLGNSKQRYVMVPEKDFDDLARRADRGPLVQLLKDFKDHILGLGIVKRLRATIAKLKEEMADLIRTNDRLTKDLQYVIEDRNKYKYQLQDQEYYLTEQERNEIAEKIIQRKDLELEDGDRTFEKDDLDFSR